MNIRTFDSQVYILGSQSRNFYIQDFFCVILLINVNVLYLLNKYSEEYKFVMKWNRKTKATFSLSVTQHRRTTRMVFVINAATSFKQIRNGGERERIDMHLFSPALHSRNKAPKSLQPAALASLPSFLPNRSFLSSRLGFGDLH